MTKFINLVKNEYIKLIHKTGTWVMAAIILIACIGMPCIALYAKSTHESYMESRDSNIFDSYRSEINYYKEAKIEGWERAVEENQYLIDNEITEAWMIGAVSLMLDIKYDADEYDIGNSAAIAESIDKSVRNEDWKSYFETAIELSEKYEGFIDDSEVQIYKLCLKDEIAPYSQNWKYEIAQTLEYSKQQLKMLEEQKSAGQQIDYSEIQSLEEVISKYQYRLDNNVDFDVAENQSWTMGSFNFWSVFGSSTSLITCIGVFVIIVAGGIVSSEFSGGTIKFLMINPVKRWKILTSKYFTSITIGYIVMILVFIVSILTSMLLFGADHLNASYLSVSGNKVAALPGFLYVAECYLLKSIEFVVMGSLAFAISSLFRSSALAIGISVMAMLGGNTITLVLSELQFDWGRYLIFSNLNIKGIINGNSMFAGQTLLSALAVIAVHMVIFLLTAWDGFIKREV